MPRLNLDIFEDSEREIGAADSAVRDTAPKKEPESRADAPVAKEEAVKPGKAAVTSRFVPVGFHERHLHALDQAVLALRWRGHWKASKSAIVRGLIEAHERELERFGIE